MKEFVDTLLNNIALFTTFDFVFLLFYMIDFFSQRLYFFDFKIPQKHIQIGPVTGVQTQI